MESVVIQKLRADLELSVSEAARWVGTDRRTVQRWERGTVSPPHSAIVLLEACRLSPVVKAFVAAKRTNPAKTAATREVDRKMRSEYRAWLKTGDVTKAQLLEIYRAHEGRCHYCRDRVEATFTPHYPVGFDHVMARRDGGKHTAANIVVACIICNRGKN